MSIRSCRTCSCLRMIPFIIHFPLFFNIWYLIKWSTRCKNYKINTLNFKICLTITNKSSSNAKIDYLPFSDLEKYLYDKRNPSYLRDLDSFSVENYVKFLGWIGYKLMLYPKVLGLDHLFPFFRIFHVDLVQILQGV